MRWLLPVVITLLVVFVIAAILLGSMDLAAKPAGAFENRMVTRIKYRRIGGKDVSNPSPDTPETIAEGAEHFQHHCEVCHGLDGQNTGVPFAEKSTPPVADLASSRVQHYSDGQLKWIIDNGIRFTGMPGWKGVLDDNEGWAIVRYIRHLPPKGSLGAPEVFNEAEEEHEHGAAAEHAGHEHQPAPAGHTHPHK